MHTPDLASELATSAGKGPSPAATSRRLHIVSARAVSRGAPEARDSLATSSPACAGRQGKPPPSFLGLCNTDSAVGDHLSDVQHR